MSDQTVTDSGSKVLNRLSIWLVDQREKTPAMSERWVALADVTKQMHEIQQEADLSVVPTTRIEVASILSHRTKQGKVELLLNGERAQMDLDKAREVLGMLSGAIEAAVSDTLIYQFLVEKVGLSAEKAGSALLDFRELRQGSRSTVYPM